MMMMVMSCRCCIANNEQQGAGKVGTEIGPNGVKEGPKKKRISHTDVSWRAAGPNVKCHGFPAGPKCLRGGPASHCTLLWKTAGTKEGRAE